MVERLLSRPGSCSRITLSPFPARSTLAPVSLGRHGNSRSIPPSVFTVSFPSSTYLLSSRSRTYSTNSSASARPAPSASLLSPSSIDSPIYLVEEEHALITKRISEGAIWSPNRLIHLLHATPTLFALETTEALMSIYVDFDQLLRGRTGKELESGKTAIVRATRAINECWEELVKRKDIQEDSKAALATRLYPDVLMAALKCEDWKTLETLCLPLSQATFGGKNPVLAEDLSNVLLAYLDCPGPQAVGPKRAATLLFQILSPILNSLDTSGLPSALESLWPALKNHPDIVPSLFFERLLPVAVEEKQVQILKEMWEAMKGRPAVLRFLARHYISFHATTDRTSEIPQIIRDLIDRNAFKYLDHSRVALHSYYNTSSDPVAAARFLVDFRSEIPEPALHRLVTQLLSSKWGPGVTSKEETMKEVRWVLEEAFGADLWGKVDDAEATAQASKQEVERAGLT